MKVVSRKQSILFTFMEATSVLGHMWTIARDLRFVTCQKIIIKYRARCSKIIMGFSTQLICNTRQSKISGLSCTMLTCASACLKKCGNNKQNQQIITSVQCKVFKNCMNWVPMFEIKSTLPKSSNDTFCNLGINMCFEIEI